MNLNTISSSNVLQELSRLHPQATSAQTTIPTGKMIRKYFCLTSSMSLGDMYLTLERRSVFASFASFASLQRRQRRQRRIGRFADEYLEFDSTWAIPWDLIPALFGSPSDPDRRPLKQFIFNKSENYGDDHITPKKDIPPLLDLRKAGFDFQYRDSNLKDRDLFRVSLDFHNLSVPF
ncbi:hypothetical protein D9613_001438 [Agrocybe pediades]|uniref:Uncharacterized protein n=1 Tax=Agrocybe pediades TaxID=84607 RepID=A0A8H4R7C6_9AGAR|nr:hypothetical protein D9613_001438 [Agrocybe pediades]